jgi:lipid-binding SYLF domain-containing protein
MTISKFAATAALAAALMASSAAYASEETNLVDHATRVADHMKSDPAFAAAQDMLHRAKAVLIIPALVKGGFVFGAEGGDGVLLKHNGHGSWSAPAFYEMGSASFGLQIGLEKAEIVMLIMSDRALRGIEQSDFKIGAGGGITVVNLSSGAEGATSGNGSGDIVVWTSATGAYGGLTFNGSIIKTKHEWNTGFYGHDVSVHDILMGRVSTPEARPLQDELASIH